MFSHADTVAASSPVLGYHDCDSRYQQLLRKLDHKRHGVSDDVQKASELKYVLYKAIVHGISIECTCM